MKDCQLADSGLAKDCQLAHSGLTKDCQLAHSGLKKDCQPAHSGLAKDCQLADSSLAKDCQLADSGLAKDRWLADSSLVKDCWPSGSSHCCIGDMSIDQSLPVDMSKACEAITQLHQQKQSPALSNPFHGLLIVTSSPTDTTFPFSFTHSFTVSCTNLFKCYVFHTTK